MEHTNQRAAGSMQQAAGKKPMQRVLSFFAASSPLRAGALIPLRALRARGCLCALSHICCARRELHRALSIDRRAWHSVVTQLSERIRKQNLSLISLTAQYQKSDRS
jgi:hypothetical protein